MTRIANQKKKNYFWLLKYDNNDNKNKTKNITVVFCMQTMTTRESDF